MSKPTRGKGGKFTGSIGDGKTVVPTPADHTPKADETEPSQPPTPDYTAMHTALAGHTDNPAPKLVARRSKNSITIHAAGCTHAQTEILGSMSEVTPESFQAMANEVDPDADYDAASCALHLAMYDPDGDFTGWMTFLRQHGRWRANWSDETT